jgi:hypothetical protein
MRMHTSHRRQYERREIDLRVSIWIAESHQEQVSPIAGMMIPGRMTNVSAGGAHVIVSTFLPRATRIELEIPAGGNLPAGRTRACVMKVQMADREPHYGLGLKFEEIDNPLIQALQELEPSEEKP